jgi:hypothetical protein
MRDIKTRLLVGHSKDCYAIKNVLDGRWQTPWAFFTGAVEWRDSRGRKVRHGYSRWIQVRCNCHECPANMIVNEGTVLECLPHGDKK